MRRALWTICTLLAVAAVAGCHGNDGAVSVRWRIVDLTSGSTFDPKSDSDSAGLCCPAANVMNKQCNFQSPWVIRSLAVTLQNPTTPTDATRSESFPCGGGENTTSFTLPTGTWAIGLAVVATDGLGQPAPAQVPPPEIHTIVKGEIVNLQVIEIGVNPLNQPPGPAPLPGGTQMVTF